MSNNKKPAIWQAIIEVNKSRSPYIEEIIDLARRTASDLKITGKRLEFIYNANKYSDLEVMLSKVMGWKSTVVFVNGHLVRAHALYVALECLLYSDGARQKSICKFCPAYGRCEKSTRNELNQLAREYEEERRIKRYEQDHPEPPDEQ